MRESPELMSLHSFIINIAITLKFVACIPEEVMQRNIDLWHHFWGSLYDLLHHCQIDQQQ